MTRPTGTWTDHLRRAWHDHAGRFQTLDRLAHRAYFHVERARWAVELTPDVLPYLRVESRWAKPGPVSVRVHPLDGAKVQLRPRTTDATSLRDTFRDMVHPPPPEIADPAWIVDLGANIGMTVAHNALRFPRARFVAVELDPGNTELARANTAAWADRITLLQGAVWEFDGEVPYEHDLGHEHGFKVTDTARSTTKALSMDTILSHVPAERRVDYVKMDVEGVESKLLKQDWLQRIDSIGLQVHDPYTLADCAHDLNAHGFDSRVIPRRKNYIVGVRRGL